MRWIKPTTVAWFGVKRNGNKNFQFPRVVSSRRLSFPRFLPPIFLVLPPSLPLTLRNNIGEHRCDASGSKRHWIGQRRGSKSWLSPAQESRQLANFQIYTLAVRSRAACFAETSATFSSHERMGEREGWVRVLAPCNVPFYSPRGCKYFACPWERTLTRTDLFSCTNSSEVRSRDLSFMLLLREDRQRLRLWVRSAFKESIMNTYLH